MFFKLTYSLRGLMTFTAFGNTVIQLTLTFGVYNTILCIVILQEVVFALFLIELLD